MSGTDGPRPLVSAILPTRNRAHLLPRAIDSILAQEGRGTQFDVDTIVVDDASSDDTPAVVGRYPGVRYIRLEPQRGPAAARNAGIKSSTGKYVAFQDDDDLWLPEKLRTQTEALERHPEVGLAYGQSLIRKEQGDCLWPELDEAPSGLVFTPLLKNCFCAHPPGVLIRRDVFAKVGLFDEQLRTNEDYDLWLRIAFHFPFLFVPVPVAVYHESPHGLYFSSLRQGGAEQDGRVVVERALAMLPDGPRYDAMRREAQLHHELTLVIHKLWFVTGTARWEPILRVISQFPDILRYRWGRAQVAMEAGAQILPARDPVAVGQTLCTQIRDSIGQRGLKARLWLRLTLAAIWSEAAISLGNRPPGIGGAAAARAVLYDPSKLRKKTILVRLWRALRWRASVGTMQGRRGQRSRT